MSNAKETEFWTESEFKSALDRIKAWDINQIKGRIEGLRKDWLKNDTNWKKVWAYVWGLYNGGMKYISCEMFVALCGFLLGNRYPLVDDMVEFFKIAGDKDPTLVVYKDLWSMVLNFLQVANADLTNIDENGKIFFFKNNRCVAVDD